MVIFGHSWLLLAVVGQFWRFFALLFTIILANFGHFWQTLSHFRSLSQSCRPTSNFVILGNLELFFFDLLFGLSFATFWVFSAPCKNCFPETCKCKKKIEIKLQNQNHTNLPTIMEPTLFPKRSELTRGFAGKRGGK